MKQLTLDDFRVALRRRFVSAQRAGKAAIEVNAGDLHREVGVYPEPGHSMPTCCNVMWEAKAARDAVVSSPPKKRGASLTIRYALPR
jgi:hypothetical protein